MDDLSTECRPAPGRYALPIHLVDCQDNPFDLSPAVNAIMKAENWLLERMPDDQPLVIIMGEIHEMASHVALQQAVLKAHLEQLQDKPQRTFSFGAESPKTENNDDFVSEFDMSCRKNNEDANLANIHLYNFLSRHKISFSNNDIPYFWTERGLVIDTDESEFAQYIVKKYAPAEMQDRAIYRQSDYRDSSLGIALSNRAIVENALVHLERSQSKIYIQKTGLSHVFGEGCCCHKFEDSLVNRFEEAGCTVLPVFPALPDFSWETNIPEEAIPRSIQSVTTCFMDSSMFKNLQPERKNIWERMFGTKEEQHYKKLQANSGTLLEI